MFTITPYWMGTGVGLGLTGITSPAYPNFSAPSYPNSAYIPLAAIDMAILLGPGPLPGTPVAQVDITAFQMTVDLGAAVPAVTGSKYSPDVFDGVMQVSLPSLTVMESDLVTFNDFIAETPLVIEITITEPSPGTGIIKFTLPNFTLGQATKSDMRRDGGPLTRNIQVPTARVGVDNSGGANPATMVTIETNY